MPRTWRFVVGGVVVLLASPLSGCRLAPMPGGVLSGLTTSHSDRAVVNQAAKSNFPSPSDVGLASQSDEKKSR